MVELRHNQVETGDSSIHVVEAGDPAAPAVVFLHGWPESWLSWRAVMALAAPHVHAVALDMPGIGGSTGEATDGSKHEIAGVVHGVALAMGLQDVTLVGQDAGGMVAYAYARAHDPARVVIADVVVPGLGPWDEVLANPYLWHFAFHGCRHCPNGSCPAGRPSTSTTSSTPSAPIPPRSRPRRGRPTSRPMPGRPR